MANLLLLMRNDHSFMVDTSHKACGEFGWHHGDRFIDNHGDAGEVMGVAPGVGKQSTVRVLWVILDKNRCPASTISGYASYYVNKAGDADASSCMRRPNSADIVDEIFNRFGPDYR